MTGPAPIPSLTPGSRLGDLLLVRELGRGNQGVVFEAQQVSLGRSVAVKILPSEITRVDEQLDRFHREAEAAARLTHPNIVAVYGFDDTLGYPLIVQELVTGGSLEKVLVGRAERKMGTDVASCQWAAETCRQLAEALEHAHQRNVIHRDIKPGNVLLTVDGVPKIADFGLAKVSDLMDLSHTGTIVGTPHYMSPEQVSGRSQGLDARTDVYALGALLYRMLTHEVPFSGDSLQRMFNDILTREPRPPRKLQPGVHPDLEAVCLKALEKSPQARYATAQDMAADLARFLRGETTVARPVGVLGQLQRRVGRQSTVALVVLALLVPTAWLATDVLLRRDAAEHVGRHDARAIVAAIAGLLLAWPLSHLGTRLARGRALGAAAGFGVALLLGAGASVLAIDQKTTQLHHAARDELARRLELEEAGSRGDLADLDEYVSDWETRFDRDDLLLLTLGCLKRERPVQASQWVERLSGADAAVDTPVEDALHAAIATALGDEPAAAAAEARVRAAEGVERDWHVWERIGDILFDTQRNAEARASYERAARLPGADRDQLNLELARVSAGLCEWDQAADVLQDVMKWQPDNPAALQLAIRIALRGRDWSGAGTLVDRYVVNPEVGPVGRLTQRFVLLLDSGRRDEASQLVMDARDTQGADPLVREWCARRANDLGREENSLAAAARASDDATGAERHATAALDLLESSRADYEALTQMPGDSLPGRVGLSASLIRLVPYQKDRAAALYDEAAAHARRAIELDPYFWQAHYNLGVALLSRALLDAAGDDAAVPTERWQPVTEALLRSVQVNGLQVSVLNDAAHALAMQCRAAGSNDRLPEALGLVRRAIALGERAVEGSCTPGALDRGRLSSCWDTLSEVQEQAGDVPAALESARESLAVLGPNDAGRTKRAARIARLEQLPPVTR